MLFSRDMQTLFDSIKEAYNSLWHVKVLGESLEIITPMITTNNAFVSVFVTKRDNSFIVTDGGWISAGFYDCELEDQSSAFKKLFQYYLENYQIQQTIGHGRILFYKRVYERPLVVNAVFELANFISSIVSGSNIQFQAEKKEKRFRMTVREYLSKEFEEGAFRFSQGLTQNSSIVFNAISNFTGHLQLLNFVTGSNSGYYRDSLCRSNFYFEAARAYFESHKINKTVAILDDSAPSVFYSPSVRELIDLSQGREGVVLVPWKERKQLNQLLRS